MRFVLLFLLPIFGTIAIAGPLPIASQPGEKLFYPSRDRTIHRNDLILLDPSSSVTVYYEEQPRSDLVMSTKFDMTMPTVLLENSARIAGYHCSADKLTVEFTDQEAYSIAVQSWPRDQLALITSDVSCNSREERGVYIAERTGSAPNSKTMMFALQKQSWKGVATTMTINYLDVDVKDEPSATALQVQHKRNAEDGERSPQLEPRAQASQVCVNQQPKGYVCGSSGSLQSQSLLVPSYNVASMQLCRDACLLSSKCVSFGFGKNTCSLFGTSIIKQGFRPVTNGATAYFNRHCFSCKSSASTSTLSSSSKQTSASLTTTTAARVSTSSRSVASTTSTKSVTSSPQRASTTSRGSSASTSTASTTATTTATTTTLGLGFAVTPVKTLNAQQLVYYSQATAGISYNTDGTVVAHTSSKAYTATISAPPANPTDTSKQAALQDALAVAKLPNFADTLASIDSALAAAFGTDNSTAADGNTTDSSGDGTDSSTQAGSVTRSIARRSSYSFSDFLGDMDTYACNDFVTTLSETAEGLCSIKDGAEAIYCLATGCYKTAAPPVQYPIDYTFPQLMLPGFSGGYVYKGGASTLVCDDCGMTINNLRISGTIIVDMSTTSLVDAVLTISQDTVAKLKMSLYTTGADTGSWSYVMSTTPITQLTAASVFSISPQLLYAIGAKWSATSAAKYSGGATVSLNGASVTVSPANGSVGTSSGWTPNVNLITPSFGGSGASLTPFVQSSLQLSIIVFGQTIQNSVSITSQTSLGFMASLVTLNKVGYTPCGGGQLQTSVYTGITNSISLSTGNNKLYSRTGTSQPVCADVPLSPPSSAQISALSGASNAPAFCSSYISYSPPTSTLTNSLTSFVATETITVTGTGTTTIIPDTVTITETVTSSVSSAPANMKRSLPTSASDAEDVPGPAGPDIEARALAARRVIATPTVLSTWVPQQVSAACSQIATGVVTTTVTATQLVTSGVTTSTVQGTVTADVPTSTATSTVYVPAVAPYNLIGDVNFANNAWRFRGGVVAKKISCIGTTCLGRWVQFNLVDGNLSGELALPLSNLEPGWAYRFTIMAGFASDTDSCTVTYALDDTVIASFSPTNNWSGSNTLFGPAMTASIPYEIIPISESQTFYIRASCEQSTGKIAFKGAQIYGPTQPW